MQLSTTPTATATKQIDPTDLNWAELALLRKSDAFMYYSIPGARDHQLVGQEIDLTGLGLPEGPVSKSFTAGAIKNEPNAELVTRQNVSKSFTTGAVKNEPNAELVRTRQPRRHSDVDKPLATKRESIRESLRGSAILDPSLIIDEDEEFKPSNAKHCRSKSSVQDIMDELDLFELDSNHRRTASEPPEQQRALVKRKSAISFETVGDSLMDEAVAELSVLQPQVERRPSYNHVSEDGIRRGSVLQDILFASIQAMAGEGAWSDFEDEED